MPHSPSSLLVTPGRFRINSPASLGFIAAAALLFASCATTPMPSAVPEVYVAEISEREAIPQPGREESLAEAAATVTFARHQASLGLYAEAEAAWNEAIDMLWPFVSEDDPEIIARMREIEAERDRVLLKAEARGEDVRSADAESDRRENYIVEQIIEGPEPALDPLHVEEVEQATESLEPDYPIVLNDRVVAWIEAYSGRLKNWFRGSLERSGRYKERFRDIFAEEGVPRDLVYLAHVESGFKTRAYSRAHAKGIFQFISGTGRRYGLATDWWLDERSDPEKSCRASASYLRDLYEEFGDWYLALASYNAGEGRVRRSIRSARSKDYWTLSKKGLLRRETRNYVPAILAATLIAKNPEKFGFHDLQYESPEPYEIVTVSTPTDLEVAAGLVGTDVDTLERLNPALRRGQTPPKRPDFALKVPAGFGHGFEEKLARIPVNKRIVKSLYRVQRGDTLSVIARGHGSSVYAIQQANGMGRRTLLRIGQVLEIPRGPTTRSSGRTARASASGSSSSSSSSAKWHRVRRGETLGRIARRYGVSVRDLQGWNNLGRSTRILSGQRLKVGTTVARSAPPAKRAVTAARQATAGGSVHVVRSGDTLWDIARQYGVSLAELQRANGLSKRSTLKPGQSLSIPAQNAVAVASAQSTRSASNGLAGSASNGSVEDKRWHVVRSGENLFRIARNYGTTIDRLCSLNGISRRKTLHPGDRLRVD